MAAALFVTFPIRSDNSRFAFFFISTCAQSAISVAPVGLKQMVLRNHPLMTYRGLPNWPPVWTWKNGLNKKTLRGEIGVLRRVTEPKNQPSETCILEIEHEGLSYVGCLLFDDLAFCGEITKLLQNCCNRPIAEIGSLDVSHTL